MQKIRQPDTPAPSGEVVVLDATAFYAGVPYTGQGTYYTTDLVVKEVSHRKKKATSIEDLVEARRLRIYHPDKRYRKMVVEAAGKSGDLSHLSNTDISVVALALEFKSRDLKVMIISDDYSVENLAHILGVKSVAVMTGGIKKVVRWSIYCGGCGKVFQDKDGKVCDVCGSRLKRKFKTANDIS